MSPIRRALSFFALTIAVGVSCTGAAAESLKRSDLVNCALRIRYERMEGSSLITGHGTAFGVDLTPYGISSRRLMLSAAHNVLDEKNQPYATLKVEVKEGSREYWTRCRVVASDPEMDLCLVEAGDDLPLIATLDNTDMAPGARVVLAGSPRGIPVATFEGEVIRRFDSGTIRSSARVVFDHGDSGGPFFNSNTLKVIGVAVAGVPKNGDLDHNIGLFVPLTGIDSFLQANLPKARNRTVVSTIAQKPVVEKKIESVVEVDPPTRTVAIVEGPRDSVEIVDVDSLKPAAIPAKSPDFKTQDVKSRGVATSSEEKHSPVVPIPAVEKKRELPPPTLEVTAVPPAVAKKRDAPTLEVAPQDKPVTAKIPTPERSNAATYMIKPGDSLTKIAKVHGCTLSELMTANDIKDPNLIKVGYKLTIPAK
jgi:LysM repeat protein